MAIDNPTGTAKIRSGALYRTLVGGLPRHGKHKRQSDHGFLDCSKLAADLGISYQAVYKWLAKGELPGKRIKHLCALDDSTLTPAILAPYLPE